MTLAGDGNGGHTLRVLGLQRCRREGRLGEEAAGRQEGRARAASGRQQAGCAQLLYRCAVPLDPYTQAYSSVS